MSIPTNWKKAEFAINNKSTEVLYPPFVPGKMNAEIGRNPILKDTALASKTPSHYELHRHFPAPVVAEPEPENIKT